MLVSDKVVSATFSITDTSAQTLNMHNNSDLPYNIYIIFCIVLIITVIKCHFST
mgnify:FL=1